jgi:phage terminase small subunit
MRKAGGGVNEGLTQKQEKFVQGLIKGLSQRQAYKASYDAENMSDSTVDSKASILLKNGKVRARFEQLNNKVIKRTEEKAIITAEEIIKEIVGIAKDDIKNYLSFETREVVVGVEDGEVVREERISVNLKDSNTIDTKNISEVSLGKDGNFKFKLYERDKALYKLAEMFGINETNKAKQKLAEDRFNHDKEIDKKKNW